MMVCFNVLSLWQKICEVISGPMWSVSPTSQHGSSDVGIDSHQYSLSVCVQSLLCIK